MWREIIYVKSLKKISLKKMGFMTASFVNLKKSQKQILLYSGLFALRYGLDKDTKWCLVSSFVARILLTTTAQRESNALLSYQ